MIARALIVVALISLARLPASGQTPCQVGSLVAQLRAGLGAGSPAYQRYLRRLLREAAPSLPEAELRAAFAAETDPAAIEALAAALAARTDRTGDPGPLRTAVRRALGDADPQARAAAVRALRGTSALAHTPEVYEALVVDPAPEVRREAAENLVADNRSVFGGQHGPAADAAVAAALAAADPAVTAHVLGHLAIGAASTASTRGIQRLLERPERDVRAAAVVALGGAPAADASDVRAALVQLFGIERDRELRIAILASLARLGFAGAIPDLAALRGVDPSLAEEIDAWIRVLSLGLQEWSQIIAEKERTS
jgi:hypothetical protein